MSGYDNASRGSAMFYTRHEREFYNDTPPTGWCFYKSTPFHSVKTAIAFMLREKNFEPSYQYGLLFSNERYYIFREVINRTQR